MVVASVFFSLAGGSQQCVSANSGKTWASQPAQLLSGWVSLTIHGSSEGGPAHYSSYKTLVLPHYFSTRS